MLFTTNNLGAWICAYEHRRVEMECDAPGNCVSLARDEFGYSSDGLKQNFHRSVLNWQPSDCLVI
jgi:ferredoxin